MLYLALALDVRLDYRRSRADGMDPSGRDVMIVSPPPRLDGRKFAENPENSWTPGNNGAAVEQRERLWS